MVICVNCGVPVDYIYRDFGDGNIRLVKCDNCHEVADRYIEYDNVILLIDLILMREAAFRHIIFNRNSDKKGRGPRPQLLANEPRSRSWWRPVLIILFCDMSAKWSLMDNIAYDHDTLLSEVQNWILKLFFKSLSVKTRYCPGEFIRGGNMTIYIWLLTGCAVEFALYVATIYLGVYISGKWFGLHSENYSELFLTIIVSQYGKLSSLLMFIWDVNPCLRLILNAFIISASIIALKIHMGESTPKFGAPSIILATFIPKFFAQYILAKYTEWYPCSLASVLS